MAILTQKTKYEAGDTVDANVINDTTETAIEAYKLAAEAKQYVETTVQSSITSVLNTEV